MRLRFCNSARYQWDHNRHSGHFSPSYGHNLHEYEAVAVQQGYGRLSKTLCGEEHSPFNVNLGRSQLPLIIKSSMRILLVRAKSLAMRQR